MKIVCIADTHMRHYRMDIPKGDVLVHAGDMCGYGAIDELKETAEWLGTLDFKHKIVIAGNHDWPLVRYPLEAQTLLKEAGCIYLQDSEVEIEGYKFYGSPWTPKFFNWAFMKNPGEIAEVWAKIPTSTDVLITHGPPKGVLDPGAIGPPPLAPDGHAGCEDLTKELLAHRINPKLHIFGHLHEGHGVKTNSVLLTTFVNAAMVNDDYQPVYNAIVMEL